MAAYSKWQSRRWLIALWSILMTTSIIIWLMIRQGEAPAWVGVVINLFQLIIGGYIAADSFTKPKE
jgi:hypothetical protein